MARIYICSARLLSCTSPTALPKPLNKHNRITSFNLALVFLKSFDDDPISTDFLIPGSCSMLSIALWFREKG